MTINFTLQYADKLFFDVHLDFEIHNSNISKL